MQSGGLNQRKIFISSDIEGTAGIVDWKETELSERVGDYFREQMSREVAAACRGALAGGADDVLVKDAHDYARNIDLSGLTLSMFSGISKIRVSAAEQRARELWVLRYAEQQQARD